MKEERALRNKNRYHAEKNGRVKRGDGKHIDHKDGNPLNNSRKNLKVKPKGTNRSFPRNKKAGKK